MTARARGALIGIMAVMPAEVRATEHEWQMGAAISYSRVGVDYALDRNGVGLLGLARYGLTDTVELGMGAGADYVPDGARAIIRTDVGVHYILDRSRWIPTVGLNLGVVDAIWFDCATYPARCGQSFELSVGLPVSVEYRLTPAAVLGARVEYRLLFFGDLSSQWTSGAYAGWIFR